MIRSLHTRFLRRGRRPRIQQHLRLVAAVAVAVVASPVQARVDYVIDLTSPEHHLAQVSAVFPATPAPYLEVKMPAWRTEKPTSLWAGSKFQVPWLRPTVSTVVAVM